MLNPNTDGLQETHVSDSKNQIIHLASVNLSQAISKTVYMFCSRRMTYSRSDLALSSHLLISPLGLGRGAGLQRHIYI